MTLVPLPTDYSPWLADLKQYMKHFAQECPDRQFGQQAAAQLLWFHIVTHLGQMTHPEGQRPASTPAQGNALGTRPIMDRALKGRSNRGTTIGSPLQGSDIAESFTQGVALGYHGAGRWPSGYTQTQGVALGCHEAGRWGTQGVAPGCHGVGRWGTQGVALGYHGAGRWPSGYTQTQGVALGYHEAGRWPSRHGRLQNHAGGW